MSNPMEAFYHRHLPLILETMHDGLILIDPEGRIVMVNKALEQMTGYSREEMVGKSCAVFQCDACEKIRKDSRSHWCKLFEEPEGKRERVRCDIIRKDGAIVPVLKNAAILQDRDGAILGAVETLINLSEMEKRDRKIEELAKRLPSEERFFGMIGQSRAMQQVYQLIKPLPYGSAQAVQKRPFFPYQRHSHRASPFAHAVG